MISKKNLLYIFTILIISLLAIITILQTSNPIYHVISLWSLIFVAISISKFDLLHPYFWFSSFFGLYSSAYTIILIQGFETNTGYSYENTLLSVIALTTVLIIIGPKKITNNKMDLNDSMSEEVSVNREVDRRLIRIILFALLIVLVLSVLVVSQLGIQSKSEFVNNGYLSFRFATYSSRFLTFFCCLYIVVCAKNLKLGPIIFLSGLAVLFFSLYTAERDGIFRFLLVIVCALFATKRISRKVLPIVLGSAMLLVVLLSYLKYFFVNGNVRTGYNEHGVIYNFLNSDFAAAGENMQVLLNNPWTNSFSGYSLIFTDLLSPFIFGANNFNVGTWFNDTFYYGKSSRAFTLVGEGYVIGGYIGVIVLFLILGLLVKLMYKKSIENQYWLTAYIFTIATVASSFRGTLSSITGTLFDIALLGILGYLLYKIFMSKKKATRKIREGVN